MSKENDKSKTSKTARVMNLLSKKQEPPAPQPEEEAAAAPVVESAAPAGAPAPSAQNAAAPLSPILSMAPDAAVSVQIKNALEDALENELNAQPPEAPPPEQAAPEVPKAALPPEEPVLEEPAEEPAPEPIPAAPESPEPLLPVEEAIVAEEPAPLMPEEPVVPVPSVSQTAPVFVQPDDEPASLGYVNVMQVLVEEKAPKYMKMFGICTCPKCAEDVKALALNHLPPKYVVMSSGERIPKLTFYEGQYSSDVTAQLLKACTIVMQTPHHDR